MYVKVKNGWHLRFIVDLKCSPEARASIRALNALYKNKNIEHYRKDKTSGFDVTWNITIYYLFVQNLGIYAAPYTHFQVHTRFLSLFMRKQ